MSETMDSIRAVVLGIFSSCRENAGAPFEESKFLKSLSEERRDSYLSKRAYQKRLSLFFDRIEDHFILYVSWKKRHENWSLEAFCLYLSRAIPARKSSIVGAERAIWESSGCLMQLSFFWVPLILLAIWKDGSRAWVAGLLTLPPLLLSIFFFKDWLRHRRLAKRIRNLT